MNPQISTLIKITSVSLITGALGLEIAHLYLYLNHEALRPSLNAASWLAIVALIGHGIEGIIAAINAPSRDRNPWIYGLYTFFVGFIGLRELFDLPERIKN